MRRRLLATDPNTLGNQREASASSSCREAPAKIYLSVRPPKLRVLISDTGEFWRRVSRAIQVAHQRKPRPSFRTSELDFELSFVQNPSLPNKCAISTASPLNRCTAAHAGHSDTEKLHQVRLEAKAVSQREIMNSKVCSGSTLYRVSPDAERMYRKLGFDNACGSSSDNHSSLSIVDNRWSTVENCSWNQACFRTTTPAAPLIDVCCSHGASANATPGLEMPFTSGFHAGVRW